MNIYHSANECPDILPANSIVNADCFDVFDKIETASIDMICTDLPYGTTACKWDTVLPFDKLWAEYKRVLKPSGVVVLTASQPFTSVAVMSNLKWFKYSWIWDKKTKVGMMNCKRMPLKQHEDVLIFHNGKSVYNPQMTKGKMRNKKIEQTKNFQTYGQIRPIDNINDNYYPSSILEFTNANQKIKSHPTQKSIALFKYLIETYTNAGMRVLDNCAGSGTTGAACIELGREYILIEKDKTYFNDTIIPRLTNAIATQNSKLFNE